MLILLHSCLFVTVSNVLYIQQQWLLNITIFLTLQVPARVAAILDYCGSLHFPTLVNNNTIFVMLHILAGSYHLTLRQSHTHINIISTCYLVYNCKHIHKLYLQYMQYLAKLNNLCLKCWFYLFSHHVVLIYNFYALHLTLQ